jgi:hypothetical protein
VAAPEVQFPIHPTNPHPNPLILVQAELEKLGKHKKIFAWIPTMLVGTVA